MDLDRRCDQFGEPAGAEARGRCPPAILRRIGMPVAFFTAMRTWRIERNCTGKFAKNCSAGIC